ncbi:MAG TPA: SDR family oxidoreductase [Phycisphaerales bacterium]|nr:SDR family oxidoreductase [Phycisphaerales bacterium]
MARDQPADTSAPMTEPKPPFPRQHQQPPGLESELDPKPRWRAERYRPAGKLEGQAALITGGDSGIGRSVAYLYAREGADVAITCLPQEGSDAAEISAAIEELGRRCVVLPGDLEDAAFCDAIVARTLEHFGRLDILVHNAAWQNRKPVTELAEEELDRTVKTNLYAYLRLARAAVPHMKPGSCIIATGSIVGISGSEELSDYGATKGAIHAITKCLAEELAKKQIRVNCVAPGPVWTPLNPSDTGLEPREVARFGEQVHTMGRPAQPEEIAPAFVFLASQADASFITGAVLPITGKPI